MKALVIEFPENKGNSNKQLLNTKNKSYGESYTGTKGRRGRILIYIVVHTANFLMILAAIELYRNN